MLNVQRRKLYVSTHEIFKFMLKTPSAGKILFHHRTRKFLYDLLPLDCSANTIFWGLLFIFEFGSNYFVLFMLWLFHFRNHLRKKSFPCLLLLPRSERCFRCRFCVHMRGLVWKHSFFSGNFLICKHILSSLAHKMKT